jgi:Tol biopolymer transport system component
MGPILNPKWSPDGGFIAFTEWSNPRKSYLVPADGGAPLLLLSGEFQPADPTWSPDGKSIAYGGAVAFLAPGVRTEVRILDLETKESKTIPGSQGMYSPRWSPDGRYIAAQSDDMRQLWLYSFENEHWEQLPLPKVPKSVTVGQPTWSHDSHYLFYQSGWTIYRTSIPGGQPESVATATGIHTLFPALPWPGWFGLTPDDRVLMMLDRSFDEVYALDLEYR